MVEQQVIYQNRYLGAHTGWRMKHGQGSKQDCEEELSKIQ